jgi:hypothetical protein
MGLFPTLKFQKSCGHTTATYFLISDNAPGLQLRNRTAFFNPHLIARLELIVLVMGMVLLGALNHFLYQRVRKPAINPYDNRLVIGVAYNRTL